MLGALYDALPLVDDDMSADITARIRTLVQDTTARMRNRTLESALATAGWSADDAAFTMGTVQQPTQLREVIETLLAEREVMVDAAKVEDVFADANESDKAQSKGKFDVDATEADPRCAAIKLCGPPHLGRLRRECRMLVSPTARPGFSGQQPVSLAQENIESVADDDYLMSWKADGTRYRPTTPLPVAFLNATRFFSVKHSFSNSFSWPCSLSLSASLPLPHARSARLYPKNVPKIPHDDSSGPSLLDWARQRRLSGSNMGTQIGEESKACRVVVPKSQLEQRQAKRFASDYTSRR